MSAWSLSSPPIPKNPSLSSPIEPSFSPRILAFFSSRFRAKISYSRFSPRLDLSTTQANRTSGTRVHVSGGQHDWDPAGDGGGEAVAGEEAREAVVEVLLESGASREDAVDIASNCPRYVEMLVGNVRELEEHSLWGSWSNEAGGGGGGGEDVGNFGFKKKVYLMAKEKGDNGILPFLESIGLNHSSSMFIAGYVSSVGLTELIDKWS